MAGRGGRGLRPENHGHRPHLRIEKQTSEKVDMDKWNPMGGAIAFVHPNGASGARIGMFAMRHLIRNKGLYGVFGV